MGFILVAMLAMSSAHAQENYCLNETIAQARAKIKEHYALQNIDANLAFVHVVELSGIVSNGSAQPEAYQREPVEYTTYTILGTLIMKGKLGTLIMKGKGQFRDYGFYVRVATQSCAVLKVALLITGQSPFLSGTLNGPAVSLGGGLASQEMTLSSIETPQEGSPKIGYTYVGKGEVSQRVENDVYLLRLIKRAAQLVRQY